MKLGTPAARPGGMCHEQGSEWVRHPGPGVPTKFPRRGQKMRENSGWHFSLKTYSSDWWINPSQSDSGALSICPRPASLLWGSCNTMRYTKGQVWAKEKKHRNQQKTRGGRQRPTQTCEVFTLNREWAGETEFQRKQKRWPNRQMASTGNGQMNPCVSKIKESQQAQQWNWSFAELIQV